MYDTIIIGAGMSGLAAGIRLAHYDQRVCILERHYTIGGLNSFYRLNGRDYDVGLHAVTNFTPPGTKKGPLARLLRQLRFRWDDFALAPQFGSSIAFPDVNLNFNNDFGLLESEVHKYFPEEKDRFAELLTQIVDYDDLEQATFDMSARQVLSSIIRDPLLMEMLLCPLMWYGNAREHDMDFGQFCILFRSIYLEGFGRPFVGVRLILKNLVRRFRSLGGELKLRSGVEQIMHDHSKACGVVLDNGEQLEGRRILSSAGWRETLRMCGNAVTDTLPVGNLSFTESISIIDRQPKVLGHNKTIVFFNDSEKFSWHNPDELCDIHTGVIASPNNYNYGEVNGLAQELDEGIIRVTALADHRRWTDMPEQEYRLAKLRWHDRIVSSAVRFVPDFRGYVIDTDFFTPRTIRRFTWHENGAVYGAPNKQLDGCTPIKNLFICGTDQGYVGIVGSIFSGIAMANRHCLQAAR